MTEVELTLPAGLFRGNTRGLIAHLGLYGRHLGGERWAVRPNEDYRLITSSDLADETGLAYRFDRLTAVQPSPQFEPTPDLVERFERQRAELHDRTIKGDPPAFFYQIQLDIATASHGDLVDVVRDAYKGIGQMPMQGTGEPAFANRSAQLVVASDVLIRRVRLPGILFLFAQDPDAQKTIAEAVQNEHERINLFGSSNDWYHNVIGITHYLGPLLGCLALGWVCACHPPPDCGPTQSWLGYQRISQHASRTNATNSDQRAHGPCRTGRTTVYGVGSGDPLVDSSVGPNVRISLGPNNIQRREWYLRCDAHHHWMLTFGETFGLMTSLQCAGRDVTAQRSLMNKLFDLIHRITGTDVDRLCTLTYAKKKAAEVRAKMPESIAELLMPAVDRAINALEDMQKGFFIQHRRGDENVQLYLPDGSCEERTPERAVAMLLKLFRNATHGYGGKSGEARKSEIDASLLAHYDGQTPSDIVLLPYLYLLDILCNPDRIRQSIARQV